MTDEHVGLDRDWRRHRFADDVPDSSAHVLHNAVSSVEKKQANEHGPKAHEVGTESWRDGHVDTKDDQNRGDQHAADSSEARRFFDVASAAPQNGAQHAATIQRIAGKQIEDREEQITGAE